jgi:hypothetical protein
MKSVGTPCQFKEMFEEVEKSNFLMLVTHYHPFVTVVGLETIMFCLETSKISSVQSTQNRDTMGI